MSVPFGSDDSDDPDWLLPASSKNALGYDGGESRQGWRTITAAALDKMTFPPTRYIVPGILPEGLTLLGGRPKFGKSFIALDWCLAVATGGNALGSIKCPAGDVLYAALEDPKQRLQKRVRQLLPYGTLKPERLHFATDWPRIGEGGIEELEQWLDAHPEARLVVFDTWARIKSALETGRQKSAYDEDERAIRPLHDLAKRRPGVAFVVVHHVRKQEAADIFDTMSGTHGLTGVPDTLMVAGRVGDVVQLAAQGRDLEGFERVLTRDKVTGGWLIGGNAGDVAKTQERTEIMEALVELGPSTPTEVAEQVGKKRDNVNHLLRRLEREGKVERGAKGIYTPVAPVTPFTDIGGIA